MKNADEIIKGVATDLQKHGGHLECTVCEHNQELGDVSENLSKGWPMHCNLTMSWITAKQEAERAAAGNNNLNPSKEEE